MISEDYCQVCSLLSLSHVYVIELRITTVSVCHICSACSCPRESLYMSGLISVSPSQCPTCCIPCTPTHPAIASHASCHLIPHLPGAVTRCHGHPLWHLVWSWLLVTTALLVFNACEVARPLWCNWERQQHVPWHTHPGHCLLAIEY